MNRPRRAFLHLATGELLMITSVNATNATLYDKLNFNFIRDIAPDR
jgi:hypothetical protein